MDRGPQPGVAVVPRQRRVQCASAAGLHRIAYLEWGDAANPDVLICVHGLTRCARDFDNLARALCGRYRVVCPDVAGRGDSGWLADPMLYGVPQYVADMVTLIARLDVERVHWVGTSMGGLIGMALAAQPDSPVAKLVLNEAGPVIAKAALERIGQYLGAAPNFPNVEAAEQVIRAVAAPFGPHSDAEWRFLTEVVLRKNADGSYRFQYDPKIAEPFRRQMPEKDLELWPVWDAVRCPTLVIRGAQSDLLSRATAEAMTQRGPKAKLVELPGIGHAPTLLHADQIAIVREFLLA
ncbi:MAG: alpha/beta hydrolase [Betaproteobacteria bacterium]|nr:alpha/beta hydrolase [Betaproteobacteria bacterium]